MRTIYDAFLQKNDLRSSNIHNFKKQNQKTKKKNNRSSYIVLIRGDIAFKDCMSSLRYAHKTTWHFYRALGVNQFSFSFPFLPAPPLRGHSDCQCSEAMSETFSKAV